jgi:hypothetical protein
MRAEGGFIWEFGLQCSRVESTVGADRTANRTVGAWTAGLLSQRCRELLLCDAKERLAHVFKIATLQGASECKHVVSGGKLGRCKRKAKRRA